MQNVKIYYRGCLILLEDTSVIVDVAIRKTTEKHHEVGKVFSMECTKILACVADALYAVGGKEN